MRSGAASLWRILCLRRAIARAPCEAVLAVLAVPIGHGAQRHRCVPELAAACCTTDSCGPMLLRWPPRTRAPPDGCCPADDARSPWLEGSGRWRRALWSTRQRLTVWRVRVRVRVRVRRQALGYMKELKDKMKSDYSSKVRHHPAAQ